MSRMRPTLVMLCLLVTLPALAEDELRHPKEVHLKNVRQLTFGGENAEGYFDWANRRLIYQATRGEHKCDQIFILDLKSGKSRLVSTGKGRTTCAYFFPDGKQIVYSSTHLTSPDCPPRPSFKHGYVWPIYPSYEIFLANASDGKIVKQLTKNPGYDAEATVSHDGSRIVFTSKRNGDIDIYSMKPDGTDVKRLTTAVGYDGGPFFSPDGKKICFRAHHPKTDAEKKRYRMLLDKNLVAPSKLELFVMNADGTGKTQITKSGAASFCPFFHPSGKKLIYASNQANPKGRNFDLYLVDLDGKNTRRITWSEKFDGFPMFSWDGKKLAWASNRNNKKRGDTNLFMADWVEKPQEK